MRLGEVFWAHLVGTLGVSDAAPWFFRAMAALHKLCYHIGEPKWWGLVFADDSVWRLSLEKIWEEAARRLVFLWASGVPLSWIKTMLGLEPHWVSFKISLKNWTLGLRRGRLEDLVVAARPIMANKRGALKELESWTGKANHCTQVLLLVRPMLQPLFNIWL